MLYVEVFYHVQGIVHYSNNITVILIYSYLAHKGGSVVILVEVVFKRVSFIFVCIVQLLDKDKFQPD